jgi:prepilin-type N-terminal cleavage/methylation domain-containing protein
MKPNTSKRADAENRTVNMAAAGPKSGPKALAPVDGCSKATQAMTLVEMMVTIAVGSIILTVVASAFATGTTSFAAISNYVGMDGDSRNTLDHMTREIRQAGNLVEFSPTHLKFGYHSQTNSFLVYDWNATSGQLTEWNTAGTTTNILLTGCDRLAFSLYDLSFAPTSSPSQGKSINVSWTCSRTILSRKTTEDMQQALIIIRNRPL